MSLYVTEHLDFFTDNHLKAKSLTSKVPKHLSFSCLSRPILTTPPQAPHRPILPQCAEFPAGMSLLTRFRGR